MWLCQLNSIVATARSYIFLLQTYTASLYLTRDWPPSEQQRRQDFPTQSFILSPSGHGSMAKKQTQLVFLALRMRREYLPAVRIMVSIYSFWSRTFLMLPQLQIPFILLVFDFIIERYLVPLWTMVIFFLTWYLVTLSSYYPIVGWLNSGVIRPRSLFLLLLWVVPWLAVGYRISEVFSSSTFKETRQVSWIVVGIQVLPFLAVEVLIICLLNTASDRDSSSEMEQKSKRDAIFDSGCVLLHLNQAIVSCYLNRRENKLNVKSPTVPCKCRQNFDLSEKHTSFGISIAVFSLHRRPRISNDCQLRRQLRGSHRISWEERGFHVNQEEYAHIRNGRRNMV